MADTHSEYWNRFWRRRLSRRAMMRSTALAGAGLGAAALVGCGDGDGDDGTAVRTPEAGAGQVKPGGTLRLTLTNDPPTLDPYKNLTFLAQTVAAHVYSRLFKFKSGPDTAYAAYIPEPDAAEDYEIPDDGMTVTIKLKQNIMVHDTPPLQARQFTAQDVRVSWERYMAESQNRADFSAVDSIETPDDFTVIYHMKQPFAPIISLLASPQHFWLFPREVADGGFDPTQVMIGTGPWKFAEYNVSQNFRFVRWDQWHGAGAEKAPYLDEVHYAIMPEYATRLTQFEGGNLDSLGLVATDVIDVANRMPDVTMSSDFRVLMSFMYMGGPDNSGTLGENSLFKDERVRRALSMALDRTTMSDVAYNVAALRDAGFDVSDPWNSVYMPAGMGDFWLDPQSDGMGDARQYYEYNPEEAKKMLEAAGFPLGQQIPLITVENVYGADFDTTRDLIVGYLQDIGVNATVNIQDYSQYIGNTFLGKFNGLAYGYETPFTEPTLYNHRVFLEGPVNHGKIVDPELVELIQKSDQEFDREARIELYHDIQRRASDMMYYVAAQAGANDQWTARREYVRNAPEYSTAGYGPPTEQLPYIWLDR